LTRADRGAPIIVNVPVVDNRAQSAAVSRWTDDTIVRSRCAPPDGVNVRYYRSGLREISAASRRYSLAGATSGTRRGSTPARAWRLTAPSETTIFRPN